MNSRTNLLKFLLLICLIFLSELTVHSAPLNKSSSADFNQAGPGYWWRFPLDHGPHENFRTEWWYYTGNLKSKRRNKEFGYELTFFKIQLEPTSPQVKSKKSDKKTILDKQDESLYIAHFAVSDITDKKFYSSEKINRSFLQMAGAKDGVIWNKNWMAKIEGNGQYHFLKASDDGLQLTLYQSTKDQPLIHGKKGDGFSQKGDCKGCASHYYSYPNLVTTGEIVIDGETFKVSGKSWMDHEFGSNQLAIDQVGWDWFGLQFADGRSLMLYRLRSSEKGKDFYNATYVSNTGIIQNIQTSDILIKSTNSWVSPKTKVNYPIVWEITIPKIDLGIKVLPKMIDQEMITTKTSQTSYWEGAVSVFDRASGRRVGQGYMELTGYDGKLKGKI
jgi:predicted secreted hydrolase